MRGILSVAVCAVALTSAGMASAAMTHADMTNYFTPSGGETGARTLGPSLFNEDFEGFALGTINGQNGWTGSAGADIVNTGIAGFGTRTLQLTDPISNADVQFNAAPSTGLVEFDFWGGSFAAPGTLSYAYSVDFFASTAGAIAGRLFWFDDGSIRALQVVGGAGVFVDTGFFWTAGSIDRYGIETIAGNGVNYYKNGSLIFSGHNINVEIGNADDGYNILRPVNFGASGTGDTMLIDNFGIPAPGAATILLAGLGFNSRRRR